MGKRVFSVEQEQEILQARAIGMPTKEIVAVYGHRNAVYALFRRAAVPLPASGPTNRLPARGETASIVVARQGGQSIHAIAVAHRRSTDFVERVLRSEEAK